MKWGSSGCFLRIEIEIEKGWICRTCEIFPIIFWDARKIRNKWSGLIEVLYHRVFPQKLSPKNQPIKSALNHLLPPCHIRRCVCTQFYLRCMWRIEKFMGQCSNNIPCNFWSDTILLLHMLYSTKKKIKN